MEERTAELVKAIQQLKLVIQVGGRVAQALRKREKELKLRTSNLEEVNSALTVLLKRRDEDKREVEEKVLFKDGKTAKEIAGLFDVSVRTIEFHRKSIRAKIGLKNSKVNLRSRLLSM